MGNPLELCTVRDQKVKFHETFKRRASGSAAAEDAEQIQLVGAAKALIHM